MMSKKNQILFWKGALILLGLLSLSAGLVKTPGFWTSYMVDMAGPAWIYILLRGTYNKRGVGPFPKNLSPGTVLFTVVSSCFMIEMTQYLKFYESHFDPYDFAAYVSFVIPVYFADKGFSKYQTGSTGI